MSEKRRLWLQIPTFCDNDHQIEVIIRVDDIVNLTRHIGGDPYERGSYVLVMSNGDTYDVGEKTWNAIVEVLMSDLPVVNK